MALIHLRLKKQVPQKQGLRPRMVLLLLCTLSPQKASSTKTRIKTITTFNDFFVFLQILKKQVPQKQGLRHVLFIFFEIIIKPQKASSTKTRIKTAHILRLPKAFALNLKKQVPQKQGLRHNEPSRSHLYQLDAQKASSTKTRIKTV